MRISSITKNAGKACNNRLYRHIRTFEKIVKNYFVIYHTTIDFIAHGKKSNNDDISAMLADYPEEVRSKAVKLLQNILDTLAE